MEVIFGLKLDESPYVHQNGGEEILVCGPSKFVAWLERWEGLSVPDEDQEFLRLEKFRQHLQVFLDNSPDSFYKASFLADPFGTSRRLLDMRDELLLAGWDFSNIDQQPERISVFAALEQQIREAAPNTYFPLSIAGFAERLHRLRACLHLEQLPVTSIRVAEPLQLLPPYWQSFFQFFFFERYGQRAAWLPATARTTSPRWI
ncbi:MAG: hypothetical protein KDC24_04375 [Saprospiraceae bacterium]|nr:hypothetical protein [Saprospiraceae bacterium]